MRTIILISIPFLLAACFFRSQPSIEAGELQTIDSLAGQSPYFTTTATGAPALSWVRMVNDSTAVFCYAISRDGKTFDKPVVIPGSKNILPHGENLPKIVFKPSGEIIALWGASANDERNKYAGRVFYAQSFDDGATWTQPQPLVNDTAGYDQRYYDVSVLPNGEAAIIWLDNRSTTDKEGSALYYAVTNGRTGFADAHRVSEPCCPCCRTDLFVDKNGGIHALYRGIVQDSIRDMVHIVSTDGGKTFSAPQRISEDNWVINGCPHTGPSMTENKSGLHFAWFTGGQKSGSFYTTSVDGGETFQPSQTVSAAGSHPQVAALKDGDLLIAWDESEVKDGKVQKRIGVETRDAKGSSRGKLVLATGDDAVSFPVICPLSEDHAMVAFTRKAGKRSYISYQLLQVR
ncbi:MAG: sialidase family protein [Flavisolibacter sp.]